MLFRSKLYEKEKVNPMSGCLWSFIPILFLMVLYGIIREPLTYFMGLTMEQIQLIAQELDWQTVAVSSGWVTPAAMEKLVQQVADGKLTSVFQNGAYNQMYLASMINPDNLAALQALLGDAKCFFIYTALIVRHSNKILYIKKMKELVFYCLSSIF